MSNMVSFKNTFRRDWCFWISFNSILQKNSSFFYTFFHFSFYCIFNGKPTFRHKNANPKINITSIPLIHQMKSIIPIYTPTRTSEMTILRNGQNHGFYRILYRKILYLSKHAFRIKILHSFFQIRIPHKILIKIDV